MRHLVQSKRIGRDSAHRAAMLKNLAASIVLYETVKTTEAKAKLVRPIVEKAITSAKKKSLVTALREFNQFFPDKNVSKKLTNELKERYKDRTSGFTRLVKIGFRAGDSAPMARIELV